MNLYNQWTDMVIEYVKQNGETAFWKEYGRIEKEIYTKILGNHKEVIKGQVSELAKKFDTDIDFFVGFLDGINESLNTQMYIEVIEEDTEIELDINYDRLYFNMLDAKADYLYKLPQWDSIFSVEKRKEITKEWRMSKTVINENKVGRNEPCPCGSGKKYKKCCGKK